MSAHLAKLQIDIESVITDANFTGLAIIDFEEWRPTWTANFDSKLIYQTLSIDYAMQQNNKLTQSAAISVAIDQFNTAAK